MVSVLMILIGCFVSILLRHTSFLHAWGKCPQGSSAFVSDGKRMAMALRWKHLASKDGSTLNARMIAFAGARKASEHAIALAHNRGEHEMDPRRER